MISNSFIQRFLEILGESKIQIYECVYPFLTPQEPHALELEITHSFFTAT